MRVWKGIRLWRLAPRADRLEATVTTACYPRRRRLDRPRFLSIRKSGQTRWGAVPDRRSKSCRCIVLTYTLARSRFRGSCLRSQHHLGNEVSNHLRCVSAPEGQCKARDRRVPVDFAIDDAGDLELAHRRWHQRKAELRRDENDDRADLRR